MTSKVSSTDEAQDFLGCFREFNSKDPVCKKMCALRLRCAIEQNNNQRMEILDELFAANDIFIKIQ